MSWFVTYPPEYAVSVSSGGGNPPPPITRLAPNLNGLTQWITTPLITLAGDFEIGFDIRVLSFTAFRGISFDSTGASPSNIRLNGADGDVQLNNFAGTFLTFSGLSSANTADSSVRIVRVGTTLTVFIDSSQVASATCDTSNVTLDNWGRNAGSRSNIRIYNIYANDKSQHNYLCNDGYDNNPVIANSGSAGDAVASNFLESTWVEIDL